MDSSSSSGKIILGILLILVIVYGSQHGWFQINPQLNINNGGGYNGYGNQVVTQTQTAQNSYTQYVTQSTTSLGSGGASCQIAVTRTAINMGENIAGQLTSNRAGVQVNVYHRLMGEALNPNVLTGLTDQSGSWLAFSGQITIPGIYQIAATLNFPSQGVEVPCTPIITVTVHGLLIDLGVGRVNVGTNFQIDVYSDAPYSDVTIQERLAPAVAWTSLAPVRTSAGGHYSVVTSLGSVGDWQMRAYNPASGATSNEPWINVA